MKSSTFFSYIFFVCLLLNIPQTNCSDLSIQKKNDTSLLKVSLLPVGIMAFFAYVALNEPADLPANPALSLSRKGQVAHEECFGFQTPYAENGFSGIFVSDVYSPNTIAQQQVLEKAQKTFGQNVTMYSRDCRYHRHAPYLNNIKQNKKKN